MKFVLVATALIYISIAISTAQPSGGVRPKFPLDRGGGTGGPRAGKGRVNDHTEGPEYRDGFRKRSRCGNCTEEPHQDDHTGRPPRGERPKGRRHDDDKEGSGDDDHTGRPLLGGRPKGRRRGDYTEGPRDDDHTGGPLLGGRPKGRRHGDYTEGPRDDDHTGRPFRGDRPKGRRHNG